MTSIYILVYFTNLIGQNRQYDNSVIIMHYALIVNNYVNGYIHVLNIKLNYIGLFY